MQNGTGTDIGDIKAIIATLEERAAGMLAQYHRLQGAIDTWKEIRQAMIKEALVGRAERKKAENRADAEVTPG